MPKIDFIDVHKTYPGVPGVQALNLSLDDGEFVCLLGPSGCGKSTTMRMLAGLEGLTSGHILVDGKRIDHVPARARDIAMVFENYALYPHLSVFDNIAMPLAIRSTPPDETARRVAEVARLLRIEHLLKLRPARLSGGEKQRVAIGRAIVRRPSIFLMDEPLGHLEAHMRVLLRSEIRRLHDKIGSTTVFVTHDQEEAAAVADRIAVMYAGRLQQIGTLDELLDKPVNRFVAEFLGDVPLNVMTVSLRREQDKMHLDLAGATLPLAPQLTHAIDRSNEAGDLTLGVRPWDVRLVDPIGAAAVGKVAAIEPQGEQCVVIVDTAVGTISSVGDVERVPALGSVVGVDFPINRMHVFLPSGANVLAGVA